MAEVSEIKVGLHRYVLKFVPEIELDGDLGDIDERTGVIRIVDSLRDRPGLMFSTLLHELLHAIMIHHGRSLYLGERDEERLIETLSEPLAAALVESGLLELSKLKSDDSLRK